MSTLLWVVAAIMIRAEDNAILLAQRPLHKSLGGLWEFAGGKIEQGEAPEAALVRELYEELGIEVSPAALVPSTFVSFEYVATHLVMLCYCVQEWQGIPQAREHAALKWVLPHHLRNYPMPPADEPLIALLQQKYPSP